MISRYWQLYQIGIRPQIRSEVKAIVLLNYPIILIYERRYGSVCDIEQALWPDDTDVAICLMFEVIINFDVSPGSDFGVIKLVQSKETANLSSFRI